jgi:AmiR/NasT family two-component response regulator
MSRPLRIALAHDDPAVCQSYQEALARLGHHACVALSGRQLVDQCLLLRPDLVIAGVRLPGLDGIAAAGEICRGRQTPIILVAGGHDADAVRRICDNPYILASLFGPAEEQHLGATIAVAMRRFEQFRSLGEEAAALRQTLEDRKVVERAKGALMRYIAVDEEEAYRRLRAQASHQNRKVVDVAQAVLAAWEVFRQLELVGDGKGPSDGTRRTLKWGHPRPDGEGITPGVLRRESKDGVATVTNP